MTIFFIADLHFFNENIITYCNRPFKTIEEMNEILIFNWNSVVKRGDIIYVLGDFALTWNKNVNKVEKLLNTLNGQKFLIYGNHDRQAVKRAKGWNWQGDYKSIKIEGQKIILFHYSIRNWHHKEKGSWHLYGHSHGNTTPYGKSFDIGVDCWNFFPVSFEQVKETMETLSN